MLSLVDTQKYMRHFQGRTTSYVKNDLAHLKSTAGEKAKTTVITVKENVTKEVIASHLEGFSGVGICPVREDGTCAFGVIDIDVYSTQIRNRVISILYETQLPLVPFFSKSKGLHLYLFLKSAVTAKEMISTLKMLSNVLCLDVICPKGKVEIFPKSERADGCGSCITLPYFNAESPINPMLTLDGHTASFQYALSEIIRRKTSIDEINDKLSKLKYADAPPCIQRVLLSQEVGDEDSGRNNFLFSFAVYAKKKYGEGFEEHVREINEEFENPLDDASVSSTCASVSKNEYVYKCKDIPCKAFCDKGECRRREFGLGRDKSHFTGVDYGKLYRYKTTEPYYVWQLRLNGEEEWKDVVFKDEAMLLEQRNFARMCIRYLNQAPMQVSNNDWYAVLNTVLPNIEDIEVAVANDTSETSILRSNFFEYLVSCRVLGKKIFQIKVGKTVSLQSDGETKYYFTHKGFIAFLDRKRAKYDSSVLREKLIDFGAQEDTLEYTVGKEKRYFDCWSIKETDGIKEERLREIEIEEADREDEKELAEELKKTVMQNEDSVIDKKSFEEQMGAF